MNALKLWLLSKKEKKKGIKFVKRVEKKLRKSKKKMSSTC